jgi:hypothetical protein
MIAMPSPAPELATGAKTPPVLPAARLGKLHKVDLTGNYGTTI